GAEMSPEQQKRAAQHQAAVAHVLETVDADCAAEMQAQGVAAQAGETPEELSEACQSAARDAYLAYAQANNFDMGPPPTEPEPEAPPAEPVSSLPTLLAFLAIVCAGVGAVVVYVMGQVSANDTEEARALREKKRKAHEKKQRKGKLKET
ncbi:unnamed protein product, partial [Symbiodinium sp. KB8]